MPILSSKPIYQTHRQILIDVDLLANIKDRKGDGTIRLTSFSVEDVQWKTSREDQKRVRR